ncbi:MAG: hypothetical protein U0271_16015 [Polyangiaceae bacterium]
MSPEVGSRARLVASIAAGLSLIVGAESARAAEHSGEPLVAGEPLIMREPGYVVDVPDAVEARDPFDLELHLTYDLDYDQSLIQRRQGDADPVPIATFARLSSRLVPELRVGLFHDFAATARLPIILSQTEDLSPPPGGHAGSITGAGETLFDVPFRSPERSGIDYLALGFLVGVMNQTREPRFPTWIFNVEARISVGRTVAPCNQSPPEGQVSCASPGDIDRDGATDTGEPDGAPELDPGSNRGTTTLVFSTSLSRRVRYFEPFGSLEASVEIPYAGTPLAAATQHGESLPPIRGEAEFGVGIIPWESRERFSRVWIDARVTGGFATRGPDYSPLYDALGSSNAPSLREPVATADGNVYQNGVTVADAHGTLGFRGSFVWRASSLIELGLGLSIKHVFEHAIADDQRCDAAGGDSCDPPTNPLFRESIGGEDGRFISTGGLRVNVKATGAVSF